MYIISAVVDKAQSKVALYNQEYKLLASKIGETANLSKLCLDVVAEKNATLSEVKYAGVAVAPAFGAFEAVAAELSGKLGVPCLGATLMNARALGEAYLANDVSSLMMIKIDDVIEGGVVIGKKLYDGAHTRGGDLAHMVIHFGGFECACGKRGCFQAYACNAGLKRIAKEAGVEDAENITLAKLFEMNTPSAETAKELYIKYFACGITNLINLFQLHELVLEGAFTEVGDKFMAPMMDIVLREQFSHNMANKCTVRFSNKEADTAQLGAALLGR